MNSEREQLMVYWLLSICFHQLKNTLIWYMCRDILLTFIWIQDSYLIFPFLYHLNVALKGMKHFYLIIWLSIKIVQTSIFKNEELTEYLWH